MYLRMRDTGRGAAVAILSVASGPDSALWISECVMQGDGASSSTAVQVEGRAHFLGASLCKCMHAMRVAHRPTPAPCSSLACAAPVMVRTIGAAVLSKPTHLPCNSVVHPHPGAIFVQVRLGLAHPRRSTVPPQPTPRLHRPLADSTVAHHEQVTSVLYAYGGSASVALERIAFVGNTIGAPVAGIIQAASGAAISLRNCTFSDNSAAYDLADLTGTSQFFADDPSLRLFYGDGDGEFARIQPVSATPGGMFLDAGGGSALLMVRLVTAVLRCMLCSICPLGRL